MTTPVVTVYLRTPYKRPLGSAEEHDLIRVAGRLAWDIDGMIDVVNNLSITEPGAPPAPRHGEVPLKPEEFLDMLARPEELVGMLAKPGEFIASAYDFAGQLLTSQADYTERMTQTIKPLLSGAKGVPAEEDDT